MNCPRIAACRLLLLFSFVSLCNLTAGMLAAREDGDGTVTISGELRVWHNVILTLDGPFAQESDTQPNPFTDLSFDVTFTHSDGTAYQVPGYFAADGNAANTSAEQGNKWRVHFAPDRKGDWKYKISFFQGKNAALDSASRTTPLSPYHGLQGEFTIQPSDKTGRDFRKQGRLQYIKNRYLQFAESKKYFLKVGADAPETLLGYTDFDNTIAEKSGRVPLKTWEPHLQDWQEGDPSWQEGKGKGLIGAINYLSGKGCNAFSFLTYNAGGDGDNVWPFIARDDKLHYDCSKLDQWGIVFEHGTQKGMYLHFKMQETEMDDNVRSKSSKVVPESLDGGDLGIERKLYCRELVARFGHNLALNWNLGEENTQTTEQQKAMLDYLAEIDPYHHPRVLHTYPNQQDEVYRPLLGKKSKLTGVSLQNSAIADTHIQTIKWVSESEEAGKPWVVAFDESGSAAHGQCPDLGYQGFDGRDKTGKKVYTEHEVRHQTLWGTLMGGGAGVEYYFGYQFVENDLVCEDWRSRDRSWDYCRIAIEFFHNHAIPFWEMASHDALIGNPKSTNEKYCFAKEGEVYLIYVPKGGTTQLDLRKQNGEYTVQWFNPREGGELLQGSIASVQAGAKVQLGTPPSDDQKDWLILIRR
ncbi:Putative collagen-binding domain of a collagenase [Planctomycetales bacterium 10988]|nr:Putative collagen-binding domain of a collagenase [Planctomycetales bacterium 10988]